MWICFPDTLIEFVARHIGQRKINGYQVGLQIHFLQTVGGVMEPGYFIIRIKAKMVFQYFAIPGVVFNYVDMK
jgi:hypothetical protein